MSDEELVTRACAGDVAAWERLMRAYQEPVFRLAYLLLRDADDAEDVAQETFIRAHSALASFDTARPLRPWLLRIATNLARNRRRSFRRSLAAFQRAFALAPHTTTLDESAGWERQTLWSAVGQLGANDQEVLYLRYFLDLSEADAARTLAVPQGTVKSRTSRALARLRELIDREFPALRSERGE